jgi:hypothetical protein
LSSKQTSVVNEMWYDLTAAQTRSVQPTCASASFALTNLREVLQVENMKRVAMTKSIGERMQSNLRSTESGGSLWEAARLMRKSDMCRSSNGISEVGETSSLLNVSRGDTHTALGLLPPNSPTRRRQNGDSKKKVKREHPLERPQAGSTPLD